jgi:hypothetical protein
MKTLQTLTAPRVLLGATGIILAVWIGALVVHDARAPGLVDQKGIAIGRDYIAFHGAARLVLDGKGDRLYQPGPQERVQAALLEPATRSGFCYFVNPAFVAAAYVPLALLPYRLAFYSHVLLMFGCLLVGLWLLRRQLPALRPTWPTVVLVCVSSFPMIHTVLGGQNAALSFLLLASAYCALKAGRNTRAGVALGLQLYKPQLALPLLVLLGLGGHLAAVATAAAVGAGLYLLGALCCGWAWPLAMLSQLGGYYRQVERVANGHKHIALPEVVDFSLARPLDALGLPVLASTAHLLGLGLAAALLLLLVLWWRSPQGREDPQFGLRFGAAVALSLSASLHTQHYDAALLLIPLLLTIELRLRSGIGVSEAARAALIAAYVGLPAVIVTSVARWIRFQPTFLAPLAAAWWARATLREGRKTGSRDHVG